MRLITQRSMGNGMEERCSHVVLPLLYKLNAASSVSLDPKDKDMILLACPQSCGASSPGVDSPGVRRLDARAGGQGGGTGELQVEGHHAENALQAQQPLATQQPPQVSGRGGLFQGCFVRGAT